MKLYTVSSIYISVKLTTPNGIEIDVNFSAAFYNP
jgi:hypothetical protein